ncbi:substrate-binding domain-containing protein [Nocardioides houyundeii]|uniref:substrate-binding domain-containing protein n=1 Tax=Nocardioides houyundeii TaxID=2045452 RepID=UPI000DF2AC01|nr:substrate-binding domain-containing protein [Nocardioides houyundeii]
MRAGRHVQDVEEKGASPVLLVGALLAVIAAVGWLTMGGPLKGEEASAGSCQEPFDVKISVVPSLRPALDQALEAISPENTCAQVEVAEESPAATSSSFAKNEGPDLWFADSSVRLSRLATSGVSTALLQESLASSPVGLATGPTAQGPASWRAALTSGRLLLNDPTVDAASALALTSAMAEALEEGSDPVEAQLSMIPQAQKFGARLVDGPVKSVDLADIDVDETQLVPVSEQTFLEARKTNASLTLVSAGTSAPVLDFPLAGAWDSNSTLKEYGQVLADWFASEDGLRTLDGLGLRGPDLAPLTQASGLGEVTADEPPSEDLVLRTLGGWQVLSVPSSILAVFDASGSMDFPAGGGETRMQLASAAAVTALDLFPRHAKVGMWAFSINQGGNGQDWRQLAPTKRLNEQSQGQSHYDYLRDRIPTLLSITQGGTGLYDTTIDAYRAAMKDYDKNYFNAVILLSDGANDDPGSISLPKLLQELKESADPSRPVRIISVGIGTDADMPSLRRISEATGGQAFLAEDPRDMLDVFAKALLSR